MAFSYLQIDTSSDTLCAIRDCPKKIQARGYCPSHYRRMTLYGDPLAIIKIRKNQENHGLRKTSVYNSWDAMVSRCTNENNPAYSAYGGRGIKICPEWRNSFMTFLSDMGKRPDGTTLERIDNNGNYEPTNCRWATKHEQQINRRIQANNKTGFRGVSVGWKGGYNAQLTSFKTKFHLGSYSSLEDAALAYDCASIQIFGSGAPLNILGDMA